jgi:hypothetical protein
MLLTQAPGKMHDDMALVTAALDINKAAELETDTSGKKSNMHVLSHELLRVVTGVLSLKHFTSFATAEALNKSFQKTCQEEGLVALVLENLLNPWKDAGVVYAGEQAKANEEVDKMTGTSGSKKEGEDDEYRKPTRAEAIGVEAKNEVKTYCPSYVMTGNAATDTATLLSTYSSMTKNLDANSASWSSETQGNRRACWLDEAGRKNPRWAYVSGRNAYRCKLGFHKDDFEETLMLAHVRLSPQSSIFLLNPRAGIPPGS